MQKHYISNFERIPNDRNGLRMRLQREQNYIGQWQNKKFLF